MANTVFGGQMNKWVKWIYLGVALILAGMIAPMALVSFGAGVVTLYLVLIVIGVILFKNNLTARRRYIWLGLVVFVFLYLHTFTAPSITGKIVDKTTKKPIENAIVHVEYYLLFPTVGGSVPYSLGENLAVTDKNGMYKLKPKISIGTNAHRFEGIYAIILRPFTSLFDMFDPKIDVKVLHPLWEVKEKWISLPNNNYSWMVKKFGRMIGYDVELLNLGEKYRDGRKLDLYLDIDDKYFMYAKKLGIVNEIGYEKIFKNWEYIGRNLSHDDRNSISEIIVYINKKILNKD